jgi:hypothetical protein
MEDKFKKEYENLLLNKKSVSYKVINWIGTYTKGEICEMIGFSRPTLDLRLKAHNWKHNEIKTILKKLPF